jgi:hypothetical protein
MGKMRLILISVFLSVVLVLAGFLVFSQVRGGKAALLIEAEPQAHVFVDGVEVGVTPYTATLKPKEVVIKLVPEAQTPLPLYETKINLVGGVKTVMRRSFRATEEESTAEIISFEKIAGSQEAVVAIVTNPDAAQISLDGKNLGFSPLRVSQVAPGEHQVSLSANGYETRNISIKTAKGYRLTLVVKLAAAPQVMAEEAELPEKQVAQVLIKSTPTGFLRVREKPVADSLEVGQVRPGEKYVLLEESENKEWYKISFDSKEGWISAQYATVEAPL